MDSLSDRSGVYGVTLPEVGGHERRRHSKHYLYGLPSLLETRTNAMIEIKYTGDALWQRIAQAMEVLKGNRSNCPC
jgi:hypothetical protein